MSPNPDFEIDRRQVTPAVARLHRLEQSIDHIDAALIHLLAERCAHARQETRLRLEQALPPFSPDGRHRQVAQLRALAAAVHVDPGTAEEFIRLIGP